MKLDELTVTGMTCASCSARVEKVVGDAFQMPGTFIIDTAGTVRYARYAKHSGDHPLVSEIVEALRATGKDAHTA